MKTKTITDIFPVKSFSEHFKIQLGLVVGCSSLFFLFLLIDIEDGNPLMVLMGLCPLIVVMTIVNLFLEGPSYATYIKSHNEYFNGMKIAIVKTSSYSDFLRTFYNA